jgi:hypothetical protein
VLRLASLLWRLRRATAIEAGLLQLQSQIIREAQSCRATQGNLLERNRDAGIQLAEALPRTNFVKLRDAGRAAPLSTVAIDSQGDMGCSTRTEESINTQFARCFLRLANLDNGAFERLSRYEGTLWRQACQITLALRFWHRRGELRHSKSKAYNFYAPARSQGFGRPEA